MTTKRTYKSDALRAAHGAMADLYAIGATSKATMREFDQTCLTQVDELEADEIRRIREGAQMSQAVFAKVLNVSVSVVSKWEQGDKRPSGPSLKLLTLAHRRGVEAIL